jgi:coenzyme Q-binding protein COQ10
MFQFNKNKILNHSAKEMFDLVMDIEKYPLFLPWCKETKIIKTINEQHLQALMIVNFKGISQKYISDVKSNYSNIDGFDYFTIDVNAIEGPFKKLNNHWKIKNINNFNNNKNINNEGQKPINCEISFFIDFEFNSSLLQKMIGLVFGIASEKMINAFEQRASTIYK